MAFWDAKGGITPTDHFCATRHTMWSLIGETIHKWPVGTGLARRLLYYAQLSVATGGSGTSGCETRSQGEGNTSGNAPD
jgi:hypothetical protein